MLSLVSPVSFLKPTSKGKTEPLMLLCERQDGSEVELVAKFSGVCEEKEVNLAREVIAVCLAADLNLPVAEPMIVEASPDWIDTIPDAAIRAKVAGSCRLAFGSKLITGQYSVWNSGTQVTESMLLTAAAIFTFDALIQNFDRQETNPNCLVNGEKILIFDHEQAFMHKLMLFWKPPWALGGLQNFEVPGRHIFRPSLLGRAIDFESIKTSWTNISDQRVEAYRSAIPPEWSGSQGPLDAALSLIKDARDNIDGCLQEISRVLT
ncbi:hypothetical protein H8A99_13370 [Bradyrhizobium sp. Arg68]|uniref:HipA family kinase n=1 Tax=Bradyrhizobium ivorense TaxID=2511166 RepID=UPI001E3A0E28|nr:HipA family kinase [Bradyrhizobium ivorense]MCC8937435.1 hypothetical protein [Bradyrhizobium ivorense]